MEQLLVLRHQVQMKGTIVIAGSIVQKPCQGGHTWVFLQYLLGFKKLGWDVLFLDQVDSSKCLNADGEVCAFEQSVNFEYFARVMKGFGLADSYAIVTPGETFFGLQRAVVFERLSRSAMLLNVMGFLRDPDVLGRVSNRVFLDIDPGFGQMWQALDLCQMFAGHDHYVTIGENIGKPDCSIPECGLKWITTKQPVVLDFWSNAAPAGGGSFSSIASWRGAYHPIEFRGKTYGLRAHEFRKFAGVPAATAESFDLALDIHPADSVDRARLEHGGWRLVDPRVAARDPDSYRSFIHRSRAEFMIAKNMYVETNSGWFSDRSICYLASGKPVLAQNTGLEGLYPAGKGLLTFRTFQEAVAAVAAIRSDYEDHSRAARGLAAEFFDSSKVLTRLLEKVNVN